MPSPSSSSSDSHEPIRFRCTRCFHKLESKPEKIGQTVRCPACYFDLVVPAESTRKPVKESDLYGVDEKPVDVRDMKHRQSLASFPCPICRTILSITPLDRLEGEILCPECGTSSPIPADLKDVAARLVSQEVEGIMGGLELQTDREKDVYGLSDPANQRTSGSAAAEDVFPVYCDLCNTLMSATKAMIGQKLTCPDCGRETLVRPPENNDLEKPGTKAFEGGTHYRADEAPRSHFGEAEQTAVRLVPVVCSLCETRMYAPESEIGQYKTCPDCGTRTLIKDVPEAERVLPDTSGKDYGMQDQKTVQPPPVRAGVDYRTVEGSLDLDHWKNRLPEQPEKEDSNAKKPPSRSTSTEDAYDAQKPPPRFIPPKPPVPEMLAGDSPKSLPAGPRAELTYRSKKNDGERRTVSPGFEVLQERKRNRKGNPVSYRRASLPKWPLTTGFFRPFANYSFWQTFLTLLFFGLLPTILFIYGGPFAYRVFGNTGIDENALTGLAEVGGRYMLCIVPGFVIGSYWIALFASYINSCFSATSAGDDVLDIPPDYSYANGLYLAGRLFLVSFSATLPGYAVWLVIHCVSLIYYNAELSYGMLFSPITKSFLNEDGAVIPGHMSLLFLVLGLISHWLFYPIVYLSQYESGEGFIPFSKNILSSLLHIPRVWIGFYILSLPIALALALLAFLYKINGFFYSTYFFNEIHFLGLLLGGTFGAFVLFRLLGRLGWVVEDVIRKHQEKEEKEAEESA